VIDQRLDEGGLIEIEEGITGSVRTSAGGCCGRCLGLRDFRAGNGGCTCGSGAADDSAFEKAAPVEFLACHDRLPAVQTSGVVILEASMLLLGHPGKPVAG